ncbi:unnamed protein product, partial [Scytosiphon promiscuus]
KIKILSLVLALGLIGPIGLVSTASAKPLCDKMGFAGLLASCNRGKEKIKVTLSSGKPL